MRLAARMALVLTLGPWEASAQIAPASSDPNPARFGIVDNSFLVEEAFNQDRGVFQNIFFFARSTDGNWAGTFTQEWPLVSERHQVSYTLPGAVLEGRGLFGDVLLNYRFQVVTEGDRRPAFAPRLSLIAPTSAMHRRREAGVGWQVNLPFSKEAGPVYLHWNAGATWQPEGRERGWTVTPTAAGSAILAVRPMFNLLFEAAVASAHLRGEPRLRTLTLVPGFRTGWNVGDQQIVVGSGVQIMRGDSHDVAIVGYASYELPFAAASP